MERPASFTAHRGASHNPFGAHVQRTAKVLVDELDAHAREMHHISSGLDAIRHLKDSLGEMRQEAYASVRGLSEPPRSVESAWADVAVGLAANRYPDAPLDAATTELITDILDEALTNISRHAAASETNLSVKVEDRWIFVSVFDDGCGGATVVPGRTLARLQERVAGAAGHFSISSPAGRGTLLTVALPVPGVDRTTKDTPR